eukprot:1145384-Pelagomonas_calceolata.AAC.4
MISGTSKADQGAAHNQCNDQAQTDLYAREAAGKHTPFSVCAPTAAGMRKVPALQVVQAPVFASQELQLRGKTVHDWHMPGVPNLPAGHSAGHVGLWCNKSERVLG